MEVRIANAPDPSVPPETPPPRGSVGRKSKVLDVILHVIAVENAVKQE